MATTLQEANAARFAAASRLKGARAGGGVANVEKRVAFAGMGLLVLTSVYLFYLESPIDLYRRLLALVVIWLGSVPTFVYLLDARRPQIPFFPLVGLFYASNFGLPIFAVSPAAAADDDVLRIEDVTPESLWYIIAGVSCLLIAFYVGSALFRDRAKPMSDPRDYLSPRFERYLWGFLAFYIGSHLLPWLRAIPSLGHFVTPIGSLGFGFLFYLSLQGRLSGWKNLLLWLIYVPLEIVFRLSSGAIAEMMIFALFFSLIALRSAPKRALLAFVLALMTLAIFNPVKGTFRMITWYSDQEVSGPQIIYAKCALLLELAYDYHFGATTVVPAGYWADASTVSSVANRLSSVSVMSLVVDKTPETIPYWNGESYLPLFTKLIPRALWPGKPVDDMGNQFGHRYFLLGDQDLATSINLPWMVELFANFGAFGVFVGMTLIGAGLAWLDWGFNPLKNTPVEMVVGTNLLLQVVYQESSFSLMAGEVLLLYVMMRISLWGILPPKKTVAQRPVQTPGKRPRSGAASIPSLSGSLGAPANRV